MGMDDAQLKARFRGWRNTTRWCLVVGAVLCIASGGGAPDPKDEPGALLIATGLTLLGLTFIFYDRNCNRCPKCRKSFSDAPEYKSSETDGLALFGRIDQCPFCSLPL